MQLSTVTPTEMSPPWIRVASASAEENSASFPTTQNVLTINALPPTLRNIVTQADLDWFIFNMGNMVRASGAIMTGLTKIDLAHLSAQNVGNWLRDFMYNITDGFLKFIGNITGGTLNWFSTTSINVLGNVADFLKPIIDGGEGGGDTIANSLANLIQGATTFVTNGIVSLINGVFKGSSDILNGTFPITVNLFVVNILQQLPQVIQDGMNTLETLALNAINHATRTIFDWGKQLGGYSGDELNIAIPRILNVEKQDFVCQWLEWWLFESDFGKWENEINPLARISKETTYDSICYQTTVGIGDTDVPILPIGTYWLPHQLRSFVNGTWAVTWSSRPKPACDYKDGVLTCPVGGTPK